MADFVPDPGRAESPMELDRLCPVSGSGVRVPEDAMPVETAGPTTDASEESSSIAGATSLAKLSIDPLLFNQFVDAPEEEDGAEADEHITLSVKEVLFSEEVEQEFLRQRKTVCGVAGLANLGNTCYMNSALQALAHCPPLRNYFLVMGGVPVLTNIRTTGKAVVSVAFNDLLKRLWAEHTVTAVRPAMLLYFRGFGQQDTQEFIRCFLDVLHQELKYEVPSEEAASSRSSVTSEDDQSVGNCDTADSGMSTENESVASNSGNEERVAETRDKAKKPVHESVVNHVFDGQLVSTVKCLTCQHLSETKETFQDVSLSIPSVEQLEKMREAIELDSKGRASREPETSYAYWVYDLTTRWLVFPWFSWLGNFYRYLFTESVALEDCLRGFFAADHLRGEDMYKCEKCDKLRNGVKQCRISASPEVLCVHLKRFRHDSLYNSKINTRVTFPLQGLDLDSFQRDVSADSPRHVYDLLSLVSHRGGSVDFGHYVAYCLNDMDGCWYEYDDSFTRKVSEEEVLSAEAYVLFYRKRPAQTAEPEEEDDALFDAV